MSGDAESAAGAGGEVRARAREGVHLCVLIHGLWGNPGHLWYLERTLRETHPSPSELQILVTKSNSRNFTYDGIEIGGERVFAEIEAVLLAAERGTDGAQPISKISVVGYSLGGLVARYAVGLLYLKGWFEKIEAVNFTTFATPHLGVRSPHGTLGSRAWNFLGARTLSTTGAQLFTCDASAAHGGRPLLALMAAPGSIFAQGLAAFAHRSLYANVVNDRSAAYWTTCIESTDPFSDPGAPALRVRYERGFDPVVLDPAYGVRRRHDSAAAAAAAAAAAKQRRWSWARLQFLLFAAVLAPLGVVLYLSNAAVQSVQSRQRIRVHQRGRRQSLLQGVASGVEDFLESVVEVGGALGAGEKEAVAAEEGSEDGERLERERERKSESTSAAQRAGSSPPSATSSSSSTVVVDHDGISDSHAHEKDGHGGLATADEDHAPHLPQDPEEAEFPPLALTPTQLAMLRALNALGWRKFRVHIHDASHSHAAIIVRMDRARFAEGRRVVRHWVERWVI